MDNYKDASIRVALIGGLSMKNKLFRKIYSIIAILIITCNLSTVAFASETSDSQMSFLSETSLYANDTLYLNDWAEFDYGTPIKNLSTNMPRGKYTLVYSVNHPTTLILWTDSYTQYSFPVSGTGSKTIEVGSTCSYWQCTSNYANVSVSFVISK